MVKRLVFPVHVADEMLGALGQVQDRLQVDDFGADVLHGRVFFRKQLEIFAFRIQRIHPDIPSFHCGPARRRPAALLAAHSKNIYETRPGLRPEKGRGGFPGLPFTACASVCTGCTGR